MKPEDRFVRWSDEDQRDIGYCPDLYFGDTCLNPSSSIRPGTRENSAELWVTRIPPTARVIGDRRGKGTLNAQH